MDNCIASAISHWRLQCMEHHLKWSYCDTTAPPGFNLNKRSNCDWISSPKKPKPVYRVDKALQLFAATRRVFLSGDLWQTHLIIEAAFSTQYLSSAIASQAPSLNQHQYVKTEVMQKEQNFIFIVLFHYQFKRYSLAFALKCLWKN